MLIGDWINKTAKRASVRIALILTFCIPAAAQADDSVLQQTLNICYSVPEMEPASQIQQFIELGWQPVSEAALDWAVPLVMQDTLVRNMSSGGYFERDLSQYLTDENMAEALAQLIPEEASEGTGRRKGWLFHPELPQVLLNTFVKYSSTSSNIYWREACYFRGPDNDPMQWLATHFEELSQSTDPSLLVRDNFHWDDGTIFIVLRKNLDLNLATLEIPDMQITGYDTRLFEVDAPSEFPDSIQPKLKYIFRTFYTVRQPKESQ